MTIYVPVCNCMKCGFWVHLPPRINLGKLKNWCDGDLYTTGTAEEFFEESAKNRFSKKLDQNSPNHAFWCNFFSGTKLIL